ncbi:TonB-dependent receptor [Chitinophaga ginsengisegetis]|uniref:SusC/RagA family TonB-linked outer membrane protein n=1 Tax=Chitinophaga ginsengisegetis TaxID=393003 RepID=UPI000DB98127|nr:TonB-dependent receptor [Chitinophaga ginsengisegetis]MDR6567924.1 TonB-linked SusC/RagA family outer membrane protein [Chitinophaga ginsengisegetis]MDR6647521.1 TonB-linked SusC/RagA family outer membrane protein [Chitinophaga ginsengisegetis]MDR6653871.1 TonB-linked SusC/RagA family outer membrane protein [Chitinophaga ginsengisegetis]
MIRASILYQKGSSCLARFGFTCSALLFISTFTYAQKNNVGGQVTDAGTGSPLPSVTVGVKGTSQGAFTDANGRYTISAAPSDSLVFSIIGYASKTYHVGTRTRISAQLEPSNKVLNQVVVVGYGTQQKKDVTGSVGIVTMRNIKDMPVAGPDQALAGQIAGIQVSTSNGIPGGGPQVQVRGIGAVGAGSQPLYVVDGYPLASSSDQVSDPMNAINPQDIESMAVLKDASATAIYGSRGANGVVLITTKRGSSGIPRVQLSANYGVQTIPDKGRPNLMNGQEFAQFRKEAIEDNIRFTEHREPTDADIPEVYRHPELIGKGTDWFDAITRTAPMQDINLSVSGGTDKIRTYVSAGYYNQDGVIINSGYRRFTVRANVDANLSDRFKVGFNVAPSYTTRKGNTNGEGREGVFGIASPIEPIYKADGSYNEYIQSPGTFGLPNPVMMLNEVTNKSKSTRILFNTYGEYEIIKNLKFKSTFNVDYQEGSAEYFRPSTIGNTNAAPPSIPSGGYITGNYLNWLNENTLTYQYNSNSGHAITGLLGYSVQSQKEQNVGINAANFPDDDIKTINGAATLTNNPNVTDKTEWALLSYLARVNYAYKDKYLVTATVRSDGSSRFGPNNRWGTFPSVALGWRVSQEDFMKSSRIFSDLKVRASYGFSGNFNIGNYTYMSSIGTSDYVLGGALNGGRVMNTLGNPNLGWERMRELNIGVDVGLLKDRIYLTIDAYKRNTQDLLLNVEVPQSSGFTTVTENSGDMENKGLEIGISSRNMETKSFTWTTNFNIAFNRNKVLALGKDNAPIYSGNSSEGNPTNVSIVGQPLAMLYGYVFDGIYQNQAEVDKGPAFPGAIPGNIRFKDINGNGVINPREDFAIIGNPYPDFNWGLTNILNYKKFDLRVLVVGSMGADRLHATNDYNGNIDGVFNVRKDVANRWRSESNPGNGKVPTTNGSGRGRVMYRDVSSLTVEKNNYAWVKNITLGYSLPKMGFVESARVYVSVQNAILFTNYSGNPEVTNYMGKGGSGALVPGIDYSSYPVPRIYSLGANLSF